MGRLNAAHARAAASGPRSLATLRAARELRRRGVVIRRAELARRTLAECIDAVNWAVNRRPLSVRPPWIAELLADGRAVQRAGLCAICSCTASRRCAEHKVCRGAVVWGDRAQTICAPCDTDPTGPRVSGPDP